MRYELLIATQAEAEITAYVDYVARIRHEPANAASLLEAIDDAIDSLATYPRRCPLAPESELVPFEVRFLVVRRSLMLLYEIDEQSGRVVILGFRHTKQLPIDLGKRM